MYVMYDVMYDVVNALADVPPEIWDIPEITFYFVFLLFCNRRLGKADIDFFQVPGV